MGIYSRSDLQRPSALPDTPPPEQTSPAFSTTLTRTCEERGWNITAPISPPMSSYDSGARPDKSTARGWGEGQAQAQTHRDAPPNAPRQQLPSLSSIFGPPSQIRPLQSPQVERPNTFTGAQSPALDRPHSASTNSERSFATSYFPKLSPSIGQARTTYEPRYEQDRTPGTAASSYFPGPLSPGSREYDAVRRGSRNEAGPSGHWSHPTSSDPRKPEYVLSTQQSSPTFRAGSDRFPPLGQKYTFESGSGAREPARLHSVPSAQSPNAPGTVNLERAPVKDGLGPKIWTGTHFLPRFVRQAEVPGEGLCFFYDDGTHCKTLIDGEPVNAHWGVTKAGKPRKRLAIACLTCREKKIKCDPDFPRCVQCDKFGRVCKFKNAPRGGHNTSPLASPAEHDESRQLGVQSRTSDHGHPNSDPRLSTSPTGANLKRPSSADLPGLPPKRLRPEYENHLPALSCPIPTEAPEIKKAGLTWHSRTLPRLHEDILCRPWQDTRPQAPL
jgi:hypothetical protein